MPPSVRDYNQTSFWDFIESLQEQGSAHPLFENLNNATNNNTNNNTNHNGAQEAYEQHQATNPWSQGWGGFPFGPMPHRGRNGPPPGYEHGGRRGGHGHHGNRAPPPGHDDAEPANNDMTPTLESDSDPEEVVLGEDGPQQKKEKSARGPGGHHHGRHSDAGHSGPRCGRGGWGGRGRGGWGGRGRGGAFGHPFGAWADFLQDQLSANTTNDKSEQEFKPEVDVFDTTDSFIIHISLPGAKKEDIGVHWDAEKSELNIAGVIHRPGDEEFLKTLALDERRVGAFERKVRLGSRANPAQVDVDGISAKLEDGILRVNVPKLDSDFVDIKKVDIE